MRCFALFGAPLRLSFFSCPCVWFLVYRFCFALALGPVRCFAFFCVPLGLYAFLCSFALCFFLGPCFYALLVCFCLLVLHSYFLLVFLACLLSILISSPAHLHLPEVSLEAVSLFPGLSRDRGRICLHFTSPIPCCSGIGYCCCCCCILFAERPKNNFVVAIQHNITSSIPKVGLQVWRAELVLSDFVLHKMFTSSEFYGIVALELGAGTGLVGMLLARVAKTVYLTDHGVEILENCASNVHLNSALLPSKASVNVRELDWKASWPPQQSNYPSRHSYAWNLSELEELESASLLVAADVIYSDDLTDALFTTLERLMSCGIKKVLYLALEKRYNFSVDDLDVVANGYSCFRSYVRDENEHEDISDGSSCAFIGTRIGLTNIPQYANDYIRGQDVELWQIKYAREEENR